ncbi:MAG: YicC family protein [Desulfobulbaceae bacterium]|nr:MAG: YicC family protein [Desulfobulbaceae bacterium]
MKIRSMTGFGRGVTTRGGRTWTVEVRSVNNRFLDVKIKLPRDYNEVEEQIRKQVTTSYLRGRVDVSVSVTGDFSDLMDVQVDHELARKYKNAMVEMAATLGLGFNINVGTLSGYPEVLRREQKKEDMEQIWPVLEQALSKALEGCEQMRLKEAKALTDDLRERITNFKTILDQIESRIPTIREQKEQALNERLEKLLGTVDLDPQRLAQEVAILADKSDVTEELVRLKSHLEQFSAFLSESGGIGRKLDFLIQELLREVNTIASKINDAAVAHMTVELKSELEKLREQVQNIE